MTGTTETTAPASSASLGALVKRYRVAAGLSQEALAERAQLSARAVSDLERGLRHTPHLGTIELLAEALALAPPQRALLLAAARPEVAGVDDAGARPSPPPAELPTTPTALVGRGDDLAEARTLLTASHGRLLTVVGPGGVGKTRLCLALAHDRAPDFADGVAFVALAPVRDPTLVPGAVAQALRLREGAGASAAETVREALRERRLLLVLDNCEHLKGVAAFVADLLAACPWVVVLASSRGPLRLRAEQQLPLAPLPLADAITLFRERARAVAPRAALDEQEVAALCRRLDCLPLALELAAAHANALAPALILAQLDQGMDMLRDGPRDLPTRQQTMRDAIGWSYDLLSPAQRGCLRALAVFTGGWTLAAALAVCWDDAADERRDGVLTLAALVDTSLVRAERTPDGDTRFSLLELTRDYALTCLREAGQWERVRERHARYYARLVHSAGTLAAWQGAAVARYLPELPNCVAALEWAEERRDALLAMALLNVGHVWHVSGQISPQLHWFERVLALDAAVRASGTPAAPLPLRVKWLYGLARALASHGQMERAEARADEAEQLAREIGDQGGLSNALGSRGQIALATGRADAAEQDFEASYAAAVASGDATLTGQALFFRAQSARVRGELERAETLLGEALAITTDQGNTWSEATTATLLGQIHHQRGRLAAALARYREALPLFGAFHSPNFTAWCLEGAAATLGALGEQARATRLLAAAATLRQGAHMPLPPAERAAMEGVAAVARATLGEAAWAEAHAAGAAYSLEAAIADALVDASQP